MGLVLRRPQGVPILATPHPAGSRLGNSPLVIVTTSVEESLQDKLLAPVSEKLPWPTNQIMMRE